MEIKLFEFHEKEIRTTAKGRDVWFCGMDVFKVLGLTWRGIGGLKDRSIQKEWILSKGYHTVGGLQDMVFINEQAVYKLAFKSKSKEADSFTNWVVEILVKIRTGRAKIEFVGDKPEDHLDVSVQKQNSKAINAKKFMDGDVAAIKEHNITNCKVHTGMSPHDVKEVGKKMGLKAVARSSAKEVIRNLKPEIAASMSMADRLAGEKGIDSGKAAKICKEYALPLFEQLKKLGLNS